VHLDELLRQSEALQQRSQELAREAAELGKRIAELARGNGHPRPLVERRKKPRLKGK
jgi:cell division protein FtsB